MRIIKDAYPIHMRVHKTSILKVIIPFCFVLTRSCLDLNNLYPQQKVDVTTKNIKAVFIEALLLFQIQAHKRVTITSVSRIK